MGGRKKEREKEGERDWKRKQAGGMGKDGKRESEWQGVAGGGRGEREGKSRV